MDAVHIQVVEGILAHLGIVFTHTGGKGDGVNAAQGNHVGTDEAAQLVNVDIVGQPRVLVFVVDALAQRTEVVDTGDALDTGLLIEQGVNLVHTHARLADEVEDDARVNVTGTGTHSQTGQRGQTHRGIDGAAIADGRSRSTVAQVKSDLVGVHWVAAQKGRHLLGDELVRGAVEAVAADIVLGRYLIVDGI